MYLAVGKQVRMLISGLGVFTVFGQGSGEASGYTTDDSTFTVGANQGK